MKLLLNSHNPLIDIFIVLLIFFALWFIIARIEAINKVESLFHKRTESLIGWSIAVFILCAILLSFLNRVLSGEIWLIVIVIKIIFAFVVSRQASISGRSKILWFFLGLFEHFTSLIVLGLSPKYIANSSLDKSKFKEINKVTQNQIAQLKDLKSSGLLTFQEYEQKLEILKDQYYEKLSSTESNRAAPNTNEQLSKLEQAYKDGLLTQEEYQFKVQKLTTG